MRPLTPQEIKLRGGAKKSTEIAAQERVDGISAALVPVGSPVPEPPVELDERALKVWSETWQSMAGLGLLAKVDAPLLAGWCAAFSQWAEVQDRIREVKADKVVEGNVRKAWQNTVVRKLKEGEEVTPEELREYERSKDADLIRAASLQVVAGRLLEQVDRLGRQFGFSPASRMQLATMIRKPEAMDEDEELFREARL